MSVSPMFPLGTVLFPSMVLPLQVFEPRYRELTVDCIRDERDFGVVLIERGSEVGGGDTRSDIGTTARIVRAQPYADGRWALLAVGTERVKVARWLDDAPYPRAELVPYPDADPDGDAAGDAERATALLRGVLARRAELGDAATPATVEIASDPTVASYQIATYAPFGPADRQVLLRAAGPSERFALLADMLSEETAFLDARLAFGAPDDPDASGQP